MPIRNSAVISGNHRRGRAAGDRGAHPATVPTTSRSSPACRRHQAQRHDLNRASSETASDQTEDGRTRKRSPSTSSRCRAQPKSPVSIQRRPHHRAEGMLAAECLRRAIAPTQHKPSGDVGETCRTPTHRTRCDHRHHDRPQHRSCSSDRMTPGAPAPARPRRTVSIVRVAPRSPAASRVDTRHRDRRVTRAAPAIIVASIISSMGVMPTDGPSKTGRANETAPINLPST